jgi:hypothetical protein
VWVAEAVATDGLESHRKAVKITVMRDEEPDPNYLAALEAQCSGQFRVQYDEWSANRPRSSYRPL